MLIPLQWKLGSVLTKMFSLAEQSAAFTKTVVKFDKSAPLAARTSAR